jgi:hypothetical protein
MSGGDVYRDEESPNIVYGRPPTRPRSAAAAAGAGADTVEPGPIEATDVNGAEVDSTPREPIEAGTVEVRGDGDDTAPSTVTVDPESGAGVDEPVPAERDPIGAGDRTVDLRDLVADDHGQTRPADVRGAGRAEADPVATDEAGPAAADDSDPTRAGGPDSGVPDDGADLRQRWTVVQVGFVDDPRRAVEAADELVSAAIAELQAMLDRQRRELAGPWREDPTASTDALLAAFQGYRSVFERVLLV